MNTPLEKLIAYYGSSNKTADGLSAYKVITRQAVDVWVRKGYIPYYWGDTIESATHGNVTASEIFEAAAKARNH